MFIPQPTEFALVVEGSDAKTEKATTAAIAPLGKKIKTEDIDVEEIAKALSKTRVAVSGEEIHDTKKTIAVDDVAKMLTKSVTANEPSVYDKRLSFFDNISCDSQMKKFNG